MFISHATTTNPIRDADLITDILYPATGAARWSSAQIYNGGSGDDVGKRIVVDPKGHLSEPCGEKKPVVTGDTYDATTDFNFRTIRYVECTSCPGPCS